MTLHGSLPVTFALLVLFAFLLSAALGGIKTLPCPAKLAATVRSTGFLPVDYFVPVNATCDDSAVRLAISARQQCGGVIYFASPCKFSTTVTVPENTVFQGGATGASSFQAGAQTLITGPKTGPVFLVESVERVRFTNLGILGWHTGVIITDAANVRFTNCAVHAQVI